MRSRALISKVLVVVVLLMFGIAIQNAAVGQVALSKPHALALAQTLPAQEAEVDNYFGQVVTVDGDTAVVVVRLL